MPEHTPIKDMTRKELVAYLESWGYQTYDSESTADLRREALANAQCEHSGDAYGPVRIKEPA